MPIEQDSNHAKDGGRQSVAAPSRYLMPALVTLVTVGVFVGAIFLMMTQLRDRLRTKVMQQDSLVLQAAALMQGENGNESHDDQLVNAVAASDANTNIFAVRLFDKDGRFVDSFPTTLLHTQLSS